MHFQRSKDVCIKIAASDNRRRIGDIYITQVKAFVFLRPVSRIVVYIMFHKIHNPVAAQGKAHIQSHKVCRSEAGS